MSSPPTVGMSGPAVAADDVRPVFACTPTLVPGIKAYFMPRNNIDCKEYADPDIPRGSMAVSSRTSLCEFCRSESVAASWAEQSSVSLIVEQRDGVSDPSGRGGSLT